MPSFRSIPLLLLAATSCGLAENMVINGDFSAGAAPWNLRVAADSRATLVINEGEASVLVVASPDSRRTVNLEQNLVAPLRQGVTYRVSFDVRSDAPRAIDAVLRSSNGGILGAAYGIPATPQRTREKFTYTHKDADTAGSLSFRLGGQLGAVVIDNVVVEPLPADGPESAPAEPPAAPTP